MNLEAGVALNRAGDRIAIAGRDAPFRLRRSARARRLLLRVDSASGAVTLTLPGRVGVVEGLRFISSHADWVVGQLAAVPAARPFADGATVPLRGVPHVIRHCPQERGGVWVNGHEICVAGQPEHLSRRVRDWLIRTARAEFSARAQEFAARVERRPGKAAIRDAKSRWGSCTAGGNLTLSWRMMLAPPHVADYLVAHEVAHLVHMNHGPAFWRLVERLAPEMDAARRWLRRHGAMLHRYGLAE
jgi:predicted metal-dependent hydrolase